MLRKLSWKFKNPIFLTQSTIIFPKSQHSNPQVNTTDARQVPKYMSAPIVAALRQYVMVARFRSPRELEFANTSEREKSTARKSFL